MDRARLDAFADGELSPEDAAAVIMHLADHPEDQAYVDDVMAANAALAGAFRAPMDEPVPSAILATIMGKPAANRTRPPLSARSRWIALGGMIAASVALAAVLLPREGRGPSPADHFAGGAALQAHLDHLPSGRTVALNGGQELTILASLPVTGGHCREAEIIDRTAARLTMILACTEGTDWSVKVAMTEALPEAAAESGFVPAGGTETETLGPWLDRLGAQSALDATQEAAAIARGWAS